MSVSIWKNGDGEKITQFHLKNRQQWLADVFMRDNGRIFITSDYGDWSWKFCFHGKFEDFILSLNTDYFAGKVSQSWYFLATEKRIDKQAKLFANHILPALQEAIKEKQCNDICTL